MTIMFVLDLSESMLYCIDDVREAILKLYMDAYHHRDKVGIVALKEMEALVVQHPTTNLKLVANKMLSLRISGFTPLAAGMIKALEILEETKKRDPSAIPVMIIITDGEANVPLRKNPQTGKIREFNALDAALFKYEEESIEDVITVSEMISRKGIYTVVIDTNPALSGSLTTKAIASITKGMLFEVGRQLRKKDSARRISEIILQTQRIIFSQVQNSKTSKFGRIRNA